MPFSEQVIESVRLVVRTLGERMPVGTERVMQTTEGRARVRRTAQGVQVFDMERAAFLPCFGEFGCFIGSHIRKVHEHPAREKMVFCEPGQECLFPTATHFRYDWKNPLRDSQRTGTAHNQGGAEQARIAQSMPPGWEIVRPAPADWSLVARVKFAPEVPPLLPAVDVVVAPRYRSHTRSRNFAHWRAVVDALRAEGLRVGVAGREDVSCAVSSDVFAWDHPDGATAGTVDMLSRCRLYVGTDAGVSHLAALMDCPSLLTFENLHKKHRLNELRAANRAWVKLDGEAWNEPQRIVAEVLRIFRESREVVRVLSIGAKRSEMALRAVRTMQRARPDAAVVLHTDTPCDEVRCVALPTTRDRASREYKIGLLGGCGGEFGMVLDDDTCTLRTFPGIGAVLDSLGADIAMAQDPFIPLVRDVRGHAERRKWSTIKEVDYTDATFPGIGERPHYNSGVIFYRECEAVRELARVWLEEWRRFRDIDQLALVRAIERTGVKIGALPVEYHYRMGLKDAVKSPCIVHFTGNKWNCGDWLKKQGVPTGAGPSPERYLAAVNAAAGVNEPISQLHTTLLQLAARVRPARYGEIGSRLGHSAAAVAMACPSAHIRCFDLPDGGWGGVAGSNATLARVLEQFAPARHAVRLGDSRKARADIVAAGPFDLFLVDGNHTVEACEYDFETALEAMPAKGVVVVDDLRLHPALGRWFAQVEKKYASRVERVETRLALTPAEKRLGALHRGVGIVWLKAPVRTCCGGGAKKDGRLSSDPAVWGPPKWDVFHGRPWLPSMRLDTESRWLDRFFASLPCPECREHAAAFRAKRPEVLDSREAYDRWGRAFHNDVNLSLGKPFYEG